MWDLQSQQFTLNWQFDFTHQLNYAAVEANWRLALDPKAADKDAIVFAAAFAPEKHGAPPGDWPADSYNGIGFHTACLAAMDQREDANNEQMEGMVDEERRRTASAAPIPPDEFDLAGTFELLDNLHASASRHASDGDYDADDGRPPGMQPQYRDIEAIRKAEEEEGDLLAASPVCAQQLLKLRGRGERRRQSGRERRRALAAYKKINFAGSCFF